MKWFAFWDAIMHPVRPSNAQTLAERLEDAVRLHAATLAFGGSELARCAAAADVVALRHRIDRGLKASSEALHCFVLAVENREDGRWWKPAYEVARETISLLDT